MVRYRIEKILRLFTFQEFIKELSLESYFYVAEDFRRIKTFPQSYLINRKSVKI